MTEAQEFGGGFVFGATATAEPASLGLFGVGLFSLYARRGPGATCACVGRARSGQRL
ncbi:MAG: PEP-CTERM sorting domain-containing protein [Pseudomonadota bacterium]